MTDTGKYTVNTTANHTETTMTVDEIIKKLQDLKKAKKITGKSKMFCVPAPSDEHYESFRPNHGVFIATVQEVGEGEQMLDINSDDVPEATDVLIMTD